MTKKIIEDFLLSKAGYIKKNPLLVAKALWTNSSNHNRPKNAKELNKELEWIKEIQSNLRKAKSIEQESSDNNILSIYQRIVDEKNRPKKVLLFDLEVSPNLVFSWRIGSEVSLSTENIVKERSIICVAYKWLNDPKTYCIEWNKGDDKELLQKFSKIIESADIVLGQNSDSFDVKWLRTRCLYHRIPLSPKFNQIDTLKIAKAQFKFNSNKLDYMAKFLGHGGKIKTEYDLWKNITLNNCKASMSKMVTYCKEDVNILEKVYLDMQPYAPQKKFKYTIK